MSKGVVLSVLASFLFGALYFYTSLLSPLSGEEIFGWRMLLTLPCVTIFMACSGDWRLAGGILRRLPQRPGLCFALLASAALLGVQTWLFMWAPLHGRGLQVSLGYFLLPLTMIATGRLLYRERLSTLQKVAALCGALGVANELIRVGSFSWETLVVALGYPMYFALRRWCRTDNLGGLWFDMALMLPFVLWFVSNGEMPLSALLDQRPVMYLLIPLLGAISATALVCYILASRLLPFGLFGLLSYVEPVLLAGVALLLGERIGAGEWLTYILIWAAVAVLVFEGARHLLLQRRPAA